MVSEAAGGCLAGEQARAWRRTRGVSLAATGTGIRGATLAESAGARAPGLQPAPSCTKGKRDPAYGVDARVRSRRRQRVELRVCPEIS